MAINEHRHPHVVRFGDCDPAGIVYFPRFFDLFHQAMETWFQRLGVSYHDVIVGRKIGFPAVHTEADFRRPSWFGEQLDIRLHVEDVGTKSLALGYRVFGPDGDNEDPRVVGATIVAVMDLDPDSASHRRAIPLPDDLRAGIARFRYGDVTH